MALLIESAYKGSKSPYTSDFTVIRNIANSKFPIYLAKTPTSSKLCAVKVFPLDEGQVSPHYVRETSISKLSHPNVISIIHQRGLMKTGGLGGSTRVSYVMMEFAPYGDFCELISSSNLPIDDKLARTYFQQLLDGLEHLHSNGIHHLDLKPENLLLGENFQLKIADFDLCHKEGDEKIVAQGTRYHRAPELAFENCKDPISADIFSAGIFLFNLKFGGQIPQMEDQYCGDINLFDVMQTKPDLFWEWHAKELGKEASDYFDQDFKDLFLWMTKLSPAERPSIKQIKESKWYNGPTYSQSELKELFFNYIN